MIKSFLEDIVMPYIFTIIAILVIVNLYMLFKRSKKGRNVGKNAAAERIATVKRHDDLVRKLDHEQADAQRRVDAQNKTFEMYEQVRRQAEANEQEKELKEKELIDKK